MDASRVLVVPAAGAGTRLGGNLPKILVPVAGRRMIDHLVELYRPYSARMVVVAHPSFSSRLRGPFEVIEQRERTGMLDAVLLASDSIERLAPDEVWITWGDQVGVLPATIQRLAEVMAATPTPTAALPTVTRADPYIHFERDVSCRTMHATSSAAAAPANGTSCRSSPGWRSARASRRFRAPTHAKRLASTLRKSCAGWKSGWSRAAHETAVRRHSRLQRRTVHRHAAR